MKRIFSLVLSTLILVNLCSGAIFINAGAADSDTVITAQADAQVQSGSAAGNNYGASTSVQVRDDGYRKAIFRFDISDTAQNVKKAVLRVYCNTAAKWEFPLVVGLSEADEWTEGDKKGTAAAEGEITYNNLPQMLQSFVYPFVPQKGYLDIDVTELFLEKPFEETVSFILSGSNETSSDRNIVLYSRESTANRPQLVITSDYEPRAESITISGDRQIITDESGTTYADYTAEVIDQMGNVFDTDIEWRVFDAGTQNAPDGISVSGGQLKIGSIDREYNIEIYAYCADNKDIYAKIDVDIIPFDTIKSISLSADADAYVQGGSLANSNFGGAPSIMLRDDGYRIGYIRFDLSAVPGDTKGAVLRLYSTSSNTLEMPLTLGIADSDDWIEGTKNSYAAENGELCYNNMPGTADFKEYPFIPEKGWFEIDVTEYVQNKQQDGKITFVLSGNGTAGSITPVFMSRENASNTPELVIKAQYEPVPAKISISGETQIMSAADAQTVTAQYTASVFDQASQIMKNADICWRVTAAGSDNPAEGITISGGLLSVGEIDKTQEVDITAYSAEDESVYSKMTVRVLCGSAYITREVLISCDADSQIQGGSRSQYNYGSSKTLMMRNDGYRNAIFRFDLSEVYGIVESAVLSLYKSATTIEEVPITLALADSDDWTEGDKAEQPAENDEICAANAPSYTDRLPVTVPTSMGYIQFDVKSLIAKKLEENKQASIYTLGETVGGTTNISFYSKDAGINPPRLELVMKYIPELSHIDICGADTVIIPHSGTVTESYSAALSDQYFEDIASDKPVWSIEEETPGVSVDENGIMTVADYAGSGIVTLTASSGGIKGEFKIMLMTAEEAVDAAYSALDLGDISYVTENLDLPTTGIYNTAITWQSSDEGLISANGTVCRPEIEAQTVPVELTAHISAGGVTREKLFPAQLVKKADIIEIAPERAGLIHVGGSERERLINPYQTYISAGGTRRTVLKFDISELRQYADRIEKAEVMLIPWFSQGIAYKTELINSAVISDDWDPFALGPDGQYEIDGVNWTDHISILKQNVAQGYFTLYNNHRYVALDMTEQVKEKISGYSAQDPTTVNKGNYAGNKFSAMLYADDVEFVSTQQYCSPILRVTLAYSSLPSDILIEQDIYYDDKVRIPSEATEMRQYVAAAVDSMGNRFEGINDFIFSLGGDYQGVCLTQDGKLTVDTAAQAGTIKLLCSSQQAGIDKSFEVELLPAIEPVERPGLLFDKNSIVDMRQKVNGDPALLNKYKEMRAAAASVNLDELETVEHIMDAAAPWVNAIGYTFTAPESAVRFEVGFKAWGQGDWEFDSTSIMLIGKAAVEYTNAGFEDGAEANPNGWHREIISGSPELRWDDKYNMRDNPVKSGSRAIGMTGNSADDSGAWVSDPIDCTGGAKYTFYTAYYQKDFSPDGAAVMFMRFIDADGNYLDDYYQESGQLNYRTISRRNGLPYEDLMAAFAMEENENFAYACKQYLMYILMEMKWRIENNDDSTQAVHLGRMIQGCALAYDLLKGYGCLSEEEDRQMHSYFYWLTDKLMDQNFYRLDNDKDRSHNYNADRTSGVLSVAACFPEWSKSEEYINDCINQIHYIFGGGGLSFGTRGEWLETLRYQDAVANQLFGSFEILKRMRGINMFEDENIKKFCKYPALVQTPRDAANADYPNFAGSPQIGNSLFNEGSMVLGRAAAVYKDIDPELSAELAYAWNRAGSAISAYHALVLLTSYDSDLPSKKLNLDSDYFVSNGYITFRENYGIDDKENYFLLIGSDTGYGSHQDPDRGSFSMWAHGTCIAQDPGVGGYDGDSAWFRDSGAHNMVTFYETDTAGTTINGVDTTVEETYFSEEMDYARIIADDTKNTYDYTRNVAFVKNGFSAYLIWDNIENSVRRSRFNLHTISTSSEVNGNKITSSCYNNMVLDTVVLNEDELDVQIEWGRMTGGYPKVLTDLSDEPMQVAEHIKITNPKNQDFVTLLYPRKSSEPGLSAEALNTGIPGVEAYRISKSSGEYFIAVINNTAGIARVALPANMRDVMSDAEVGTEVSVGGYDMKILFPDTLARIEPVSVSIDGAESVSVPVSENEYNYYTANIFDNYGNTMPKRKVIWSISGDTEGVSVNEDGTLCVSAEAAAGGSVVLKAEAADNNEVSESLRIQLVENTALAGVKISGAQTVTAPSSTSYTAVFTDKYGRELSGYRAVWSLQSLTDGVTLSPNGTLSVAAGVAKGTRIELTASYIADLTVNARLIITVGDAELTSAVISGPDRVSVPGSAQYTVAGKDQNGTDFSIANADAVFSIAAPADGVSITPDGLLSVTGEAAEQTVTIKVMVGEAIEAYKQVELKESIPAKIVISGKTNITVPDSGTVSESYTAEVYDQKGRIMSGEPVQLSISAAQGASFKDNTLSVTRYAAPQKIVITASCGDVTADFAVTLVSRNTVTSGGGSSGGSSGGGISSGDYVNSGSPPTPVNQEKSAFTDLDGYEWAAEAVEYLHERGVISGISDTLFAPGANITRAEFVAMIVNTLGLEAGDAGCSFDDVSESDWFYSSAAAAQSAGIVEGTDLNEFEPMRNITRQEMAAIVYRALKNCGRLQELSEEKNTFADWSDISPWAEEAVDYMRAAGIITGVGDNRFDPLAGAVRAQAAVIMYKLSVTY